MQLLIYLITYPFLWLISLLPFRVLYLFSDFVFLLIYYIVGYRKKVVYNNLHLVFPNKTEKEKKRISKNFYRHMCDMFLEMIKTLTISDKEISKRYTIINAGIIQEKEKENSTLMLISHYANWEWIVSANVHFKSKGYAVYQKIGNKYFDRLVKKIRSRWNTTLITQKETVKTVISNHHKGISAIYGMVSDQSPQIHLAQYWGNFMGVNVPVFNGAEVLARKTGFAVYFLKVSKIKRGYYKAEYIPITNNGKDTEKNEITEQFLRLTENQIKEQPEYYLWTHRRWKHRDKEPIKE